LRKADFIEWRVGVGEGGEERFRVVVQWVGIEFVVVIVERERRRRLWSEPKVFIMLRGRVKS